MSVSLRTQVSTIRATLKKRFLESVCELEDTGINKDVFLVSYDTKPLQALSHSSWNSNSGSPAALQACPAPVCSFVHSGLPPCPEPPILQPMPCAGLWLVSSLRLLKITAAVSIQQLLTMAKLRTVLGHHPGRITRQNTLQWQQKQKNKDRCQGISVILKHL